MYYCSIFQQLFKPSPRYRFYKKSDETPGTATASSFPRGGSFLTCLYAQLTGKDSLREIASGLATNQSRLQILVNSSGGTGARSGRTTAA